VINGMLNMKAKKVAKKPAKKTVKKSTKKHDATKQLESPRPPNQILWGDFLWYSNARNWNAEFALRMTTNVLNPFYNPKTKCVYTTNAQKYREKFLVIHQAKPNP
jgi:hypothetical protein